MSQQKENCQEIWKHVQPHRSKKHGWNSLAVWSLADPLGKTVRRWCVCVRVWEGERVSEREAVGGMTAWKSRLSSGVSAQLISNTFWRTIWYLQQKSVHVCRIASKQSNPSWCRVSPDPLCLLPQQLQTQSGSRKDKSNLSLKAFLTSLWLCLPSSSSAVYSPLPSLIYWRTLFNRFHGTSFHSRHLLLTNPPFSGCFRKNGSLDELGQVLWSQHLEEGRGNLFFRIPPLSSR